jgi:molybdopterin molybdotransferase
LLPCRHQAAKHSEIIEAMPGSDIAPDAPPPAFTDRAPLSAAWAWLDALPNLSPPELVPLTEAAGRTLAAPLTIMANPPDQPRAAENGYAVRTSDCDGASDYNPLPLLLSPGGTNPLPPGSAMPVASGLPLPSGADAVLPLEAAQRSSAGTLEVLAPVAPGSGIQRTRRDQITALEQGRRLSPLDLAGLAAMSVARVAVFARPRVALLVPGAKSGRDALTPMLRALLARDEAAVIPAPATGADERSLTAALTGISDATLVLIAGRAGLGPDDTAARALRTAGGELALHGLAIRPGGVSGLGTMGGKGRVVPVLLLPGDPVACLAAYDLLAARLVRRLAGLGFAHPYPIGEFELSRKIVSTISFVDVVPVSLADGRASPIGADAGFPDAMRAGGFVVVPETSEGYKEGSRVRVHCYDTRQRGGVPDMNL